MNPFDLDRKRLVERIYALEAQVKDTQYSVKRALNRKILECKELDQNCKDVVLKLMWGKE